MMKNWLLAAVRVLGARHRRDAAQEGQVVELGLQVGKVEPPSPVPLGSPPWAMKPGITRWKMRPL